jgi:hypothetical protein
MAPKTLEEIMSNPEYLIGDGTRFLAYGRGEHDNPATPLDTVLLLLRNVNIGRHAPNTDTLSTIAAKIVEELGANAQNLAHIGLDFVNRETKNLYGNQPAERFMNEFDAAIMEAQSLNAIYEVTSEDQDDPDGRTWFVGRFLIPPPSLSPPPFAYGVPCGTGILGA